jgi:trimethylamine--corrinoid protein Co-methyltransferase
MITRVQGGVAVTDETLATDVIREVGPGGQFLDHARTLCHFREELFVPFLFRRQSIREWRQRGAQSIADAAHERVREILAATGPVALPPGADATLERILRTALGEK